MGEFKTFEKASELLLPGGTFAVCAPSGAAMIRAEIDRLRARVVELEGGEVQLGVRWSGEGSVDAGFAATAEDIRAYIADFPDLHGVAVQRRVGPWIDTPAAPSVPSGGETP